MQDLAGMGGEVELDSNEIDGILQRGRGGGLEVDHHQCRDRGMMRGTEGMMIEEEEEGVRQGIIRGGEVGVEVDHRREGDTMRRVTMIGGVEIGRE